MEQLINALKNIPEYSSLLEAVSKGRSAAITGKLCVIGSSLDEADIADLFGV